MLKLRPISFFLMLISCILHSEFEVNAQRISLRKDIVMVDGEPYCEFYNIGTVTNQAYTVKNNKGKELILIDQSQLRNAEGNALLRFMFIDMPDYEAFMPVSFNFRKQMTRLLVTYNLIENNQLNPKSVERFCRNYNGYFQTNRIEPKLVNNSQKGADQTNQKSTTELPAINNDNTQTKQNVKDETINGMDDYVEPNQANTTPKTITYPSKDDLNTDYEYPVVERDIEQAIFLSGNTIRQDFKEIGSYTSEEFSESGSSYMLLTFKDINQIKVAEARYSEGDAECELITIRDGKRRIVTIPKSDMYTIVKDLVSKLSFLLYL